MEGGLEAAAFGFASLQLEWLEEREWLRELVLTGACPTSDLLAGGPEATACFDLAGGLEAATCLGAIAFGLEEAELVLLEDLCTDFTAFIAVLPLCSAAINPDTKSS